MRTRFFRERRVGFAPLCLLLFTLACEREPGLLVNIAAWPADVERIRVRTTLDDTRGADLFVNRDQSRFVVRLPVDSVGTVQLNAVGLNNLDCKLASGSLSEPVPTTPNRFVERTLDLAPLPETPTIFPTPSSNLPAGASTQSVVVADINGDGNQDVAAANYMSNSITIWYGDGRGTFSTPPAIINSPSSFAIAAADLNGDKRIDLVSASYLMDQVLVYYQTESGGFPMFPSTIITVGNRPNSISIGDLNNDLRLDIVATNFTDSEKRISVLLADASGGYSITNLYYDDRGPIATAIHDFNGDSNPDLAVANNTSSSVILLSGDGTGFFDPRTRGERINIAGAPYSLSVGDFNGDKKPDLAIANFEKGQSNIIFGGNILSPYFADIGAIQAATAVADFDGDGDQDLVTANYYGSAISMLFGNGLGKFCMTKHFIVESGPQAIAVGDFNGDKKPDLAVANQGAGTVSIIINPF